MSETASKVVGDAAKVVGDVLNVVCDAQGAATDAPLSKRRISLTAKGMMFFIQTCQEKRGIKCKQAKKYMNQLNNLTQSTDNVNSTNSILSKLITCFEEATQMHESFMSLDLPEDEVEKQNKYFEQKVTMFSKCIEETKGWLSKAGHPYQPLTLTDDKPDEAESVVDDMRPEDSASNASRLSKTSSTYSAKIKARAEKAALEERMAALKQKHLLEAKEEKIRLEKEQLEREQEQLRREKEQLALETEIKETNAKLEVLKLSSRCGSRVSNGMNSYVEKAQIMLNGLNPNAAHFVPTGDEFNSSQNPQVVTVRPKHSMLHPPVTNISTLTTSVQGVHDVQGHTTQSIPDLFSVMQRQN